ncbi:hypothetical protein [aff. Roholtiella sp. LEGE 12411]
MGTLLYERLRQREAVVERSRNSVHRWGLGKHSQICLGLEQIP